MKKPFLCFSLFVALAPLHALAQGTIVFANNPLAPVLDGRTANLDPAGPDITVGFYYSTDLSATQDALLLAATTPIFTAGLFNGGSLALPIPGGALVLVEIRGWTGGFGSYEDALTMSGPNDGVGRSGLLNPMAAGDDLVFDGGLQSFVVGIPEPSTGALGLLGAGLVLWHRRRNSPGRHRKQQPHEHP